MVFLVFFFLLFTVMVFQGAHLAGEVRQPLGTLPEEVGQDPAVASRWGRALVTLGLLASLVGILGFQVPAFAAMRPGLFGLGVVVLAAYGLWVIFLGRKPEFIGKPAVADDHGHGHH